MAFMDKQALLDAVAARLISDSTIRTWAKSILTIDDDPEEAETGRNRTAGNYIMVRDGGNPETKKSIGSRELLVYVDLAMVAGVGSGLSRRKDGAGRSILGIEDDIRRVMEGATSIYSASGVSILEAGVVDTNPTQTVWGALFEHAMESGYRMAVARVKFRIYERR